MNGKPGLYGWVFFILFQIIRITMAQKKITNLVVHNPGGLPTVDYRKIVPLQGNLKDFYEKDFKKLTKVIMGTEKEEGLGWRFPFFIWFNPETGEPGAIDGHGRRLWLHYMNARPYKLPYVEIDAPDLATAKRLILAATSQFQKVTQEGFDEFISDMSLEWIEDTASFDRIYTELPAGPVFEELDGNFGFSEWEEKKEEPIEKGKMKTSDDNFDSERHDEIVTEIKTGDIIEIGNHRVLCGDSTKMKDVLKLLDGNKPRLMVTDPPYGVEYDAQWREEAKLKGQIEGNTRAVYKVQNDARADWAEAYKLAPCSVAYVWHGGLHTVEVAKSIEDSGFIIRSQIIWVKKRLVISRGHYHWQHEPCWYAVKKGETAKWIGDHSQRTTWEIDHFKSETGHSTQKPVECRGTPIQNHEGDVYDPFGGSGTTMIAAEQLDRTAYLMEILPEFCQLIIERAIRFNPDFIIKVNGEPYKAPEVSEEPTV